jgi:REP element-mobilizing transposase RayT
MARAPRHDPDGGWHHIFNRGARRAATFLDDHDRHEFLALVGRSCTEDGMEVHAYTMMTNHFHALGHFPNGGLSSALQRLGSAYTRRFNDRHGLDGALFRGRFGSVPVTSDGQLVTVADYIHLNPLDIVTPAALPGYRWSSYPYYLGAAGCPPWLTTGRVLELAGVDRAGYRRRIEGLARLPDALLEATAAPAVVAQLRGIETAVKLSTGEGRTQLAGSGRGERHEARLLAVLLATERTSASSKDLAAWLAPLSRSTVRSSLQRARQLLTIDEAFASLYAHAVRQLERDALGLAG